MSILRTAIAAAAFLLPVSAYAQCAGCDADYNKAEREKMAKEAREQKDRAEKQALKEALGTGTARKAGEDMEQHNKKNDDAFNAVDGPNQAWRKESME
jgi:hypothetical protein